jgi:hypothetical protein
MRYALQLPKGGPPHESLSSVSGSDDQKTMIFSWNWGLSRFKEAMNVEVH